MTNKNETEIKCRQIHSCLNKLARKIHSANKKKGFWDKKGNEGQRLMLIISELSEMLEADRKSRVCEEHDFNQMENKSNLPTEYHKIQYFESHIKDTTGDELADAFIRMCDYCVGFKKNINEREIKLGSNNLIYYRVFENLGEELLGVSSLIGRASDCSSWEISLIFAYMIWIADKLNIPLEAHIKYKMWYNSTRPKMHGKKY